MNIVITYSLYGEAWRVLNALLALVGFVLVFLWIAPYWKENFRPRRRIVFMVLLMHQLNTTYGSLEQVVQKAPIGVRTFVSTLAVLILLVGMIKFPDELPHEGIRRRRVNN